MTINPYVGVKSIQPSGIFSETIRDKLQVARESGCLRRKANL
jgi:hypothetical protein